MTIVNVELVNVYGVLIEIKKKGWIYWCSWTWFNFTHPN